LVGLRESGHDASSADAPVVAPTSSHGSLHRESKIETENPGSLRTLQVPDDATHEPDRTAYQQALEAAWQEEKRSGRLNEPGTASWDRRRTEIAAEFGVDP
jgi:hypothetical protein